jgi:hypothetical protein
MSKRFKRVEREIAKRLSAFFVSRGYPPVERIPVPGRSGPDIAVHAFGLVVDVKSRITVPMGVILNEGDITDFGGKLVGVRMDELGRITNPIYRRAKLYKSVWNWWQHIDVWRRAEVPDGIAAIVLHRPRLIYDRATIIIQQKDIPTFKERAHGKRPSDPQ